jgi:hypothetical protein
MADLRITLENRRVTFEPGQPIAGRVSWRLDDTPASVQLQLFWFTRGKGTQDVGVAATLPFDGAGAIDERPFRFDAPPEPYSFSGKLISIVWALELIAEPGEDVERVEIVIGPGGREVVVSS